MSAPDAIPPGLRFRLDEAVAQLPAAGRGLDAVARDRWSRLVHDATPWLGAAPDTAAIGLELLDARHHRDVRELACDLLALTPSLDAAAKLAEVARDPGSPPSVRERAIIALGDRQLRDKHPATRWPSAAIALADDTLVALADAMTTAGRATSDALPLALRHVRGDGVSAVLSRAPGMWGNAIEAFASPACARVLLACLEDIPAQHRVRALRLATSVLGEEAVPLLRARAPSAPIDERLEMLALAIAAGGERHVPAFEDALRGFMMAAQARQRAAWHLQHPGVVPTVRGLAIARTTATIASEERTAACARAAEDLGALTRFARHVDAYMYTLWGWMVMGARDPVRARALVAAHPQAQEQVAALYFEDLARRGHVRALVTAAQTMAHHDVAALALAIWGRPLAALELAGTARTHTCELVVARALALYRSARPDLAASVLADDLPLAERVDAELPPRGLGPHERWLVDHAPAHRPALAALAGGLPAIVELAQPAPADAEADTASLAPIDGIARRLARSLAGATVYIAGERAGRDNAAVERALEARGARVVSGPFPGTDFYVPGEPAPISAIVQLERQGARALRDDEWHLDIMPAGRS